MNDGYGEMDMAEVQMHHAMEFSMQVLFLGNTLMAALGQMPPANSPIYRPRHRYVKYLRPAPDFDALDTGEIILLYFDKKRDEFLSQRELALFQCYWQMFTDKVVKYSAHPPIEYISQHYPLVTIASVRDAGNCVVVQVAWVGSPKAEEYLAHHLTW